MVGVGMLAGQGWEIGRGKFGGGTEVDADGPTMPWSEVGKILPRNVKLHFWGGKQLWLFQRVGADKKAGMQQNTYFVA
jgi:hypothetical protein